MMWALTGGANALPALALAVAHRGEKKYLRQDIDPPPRTLLYETPANRPGPSATGGALHLRRATRPCGITAARL